MRTIGKWMLAGLIAGISPASQASTDLEAEYVAAIHSRVLANWIVPATLKPGSHCEVKVVQLPGGTIASAVATENCKFDEAGKASIEAAVLRAQPLPYRGFESVFQRWIMLNFQAPPR